MINIGIARPVNIAQIRPVIARILETPIIISGEAPFPLQIPLEVYIERYPDAPQHDQTNPAQPIDIVEEHIARLKFHEFHVRDQPRQRRRRRQFEQREYPFLFVVLLM